ncbi:MAG TPA: SDR family oxidoreductase [Acidimicrobiales bacterium]|nr:SDR family oxidoreductase [Acidimicrobiales bacterium]
MLIDDPLARDPLPLQGRSVVVTGVSRRAAIGFATACRLAAFGASVCCHHYSPHDNDQPWGGDDIDAVIEGVRAHLVGDATVADVHADLADPAGPGRVLGAAVEAFGHVDALVANQALSGSDGTLAQVTAADLDRHWAVDARASLLLAQAFAAQHGGRRQGTIVFLTSGQGLGPMPGEVAYAAAKAVLAGITVTLAEELATQHIRVNTVNPGPVDTGYFTSELREALAQRFPFGRVGEPDDAARLIAWLVSDEAAWITGQVIDSEGGFRR